MVKKFLRDGRQQSSAYPRTFAVLIAVSAFLSWGSWAMSSAVGSSPDDDYHLASIWCGQGERIDLCELEGERGIVTVPVEAAMSSSCFAFYPEQSASCEFSNRFVETSHSNVTGGYPPVYYWVMSNFATLDVAASVVTMRMVNVLGVIVGLLAAVVVAPPRLRALPMLGLIISATPLGSFLIGSTNPSGWAYVAVIVFFSSFTSFLVSDNASRRIGAAFVAVVSAFVGAGTRADAALYILIAVAAAWILNWGSTRIDKYFAAVVGFVASVCIGFYVTAGQSSILLREQESPGFDFGSFVANFVGIPSLWAGALGTWGLGWLDTAMPATVWLVCVSVFFGIVFASLNQIRQARAFAMLLVVGALIAVPLYVLTRENILIGVGVQPRYLLPLLALFIMVALFPDPEESILKPSRAQTAVIGIGLWGANAIALHVNIRRYVTGIDVKSANLDANTEWWWDGASITPMGVWLVGTISFGLLLFVVAYSFGALSPTKHAKQEIEQSRSKFAS